MKIQGAHTIAGLPELVFDALTDPVVLQQSISGCEKMEKTGEDEYNAHLKIGIASMKGSYVGKVRLSEKQPPKGFVLHLEGKGGPGFVRGTAKISLTPLAGSTKLEYTADVQVGGLIAAVGSRMIEASAKKLAEEFFKNFTTLMDRRA